MIEFEPIQLKLPEITIVESRTFSFNPEKLEFIIGNSKGEREIKLSELKDILDIDALTYKLKEDRENALPDDSVTILMAMGCDLVVLPTLRKWLLNLNPDEAKNVCDKTRMTIEKVYNKKNELKRKIKPSRGLQSHNFTSVSAMIKENGMFFLKTSGDWATLEYANSVPPKSIFYIGHDNRGLEATDVRLPYELALHNADMDNEGAKTLSLYAGAGTIAWLAKNDIKC